MKARIILFILVLLRGKIRAKRSLRSLVSGRQSRKTDVLAAKRTEMGVELLHRGIDAHRVTAALCFAEFARAADPPLQGIVDVVPNRLAFPARDAVAPRPLPPAAVAPPSPSFPPPQRPTANALVTSGQDVINALR